MSRARDLANYVSTGVTSDELNLLDGSDTGPLSHRNIIINGGMRVYQRNASSSTSGKYVADRFKNEFSGAGVTTSRETLSSGSPYDEGFRYFIRNSNTSVSSATSAYVYHVYHIEAQDLVNSGWNYTSSSSYMTLQFWVRSSLAGTYYVVMETKDGSPNKTYSFSYTVSANTWTKVEHYFSGDSGITINDDNGSGLRINFVAYLGTDYSTSSHTNNAWQTFAIGDLVGDFAQNWANTSSATFDVTGVQLERGSVATPFEMRSYGEELQRCQRYYLNLGDSNLRYQANVGGSSGTGSSHDWYFPMQTPVTMRTTPNANVDKTYTYTGYNATSNNISPVSQNCWKISVRPTATTECNVLITSGDLSAEL